MLVRSAVEEDLDEILEIERLSFPDPWGHSYFKEALKDVFFVAEEEKVLGFLAAVCCYKNIRATIMKVAVHPDHRGKHIATHLLKASIEHFKERKIQEVELNVDMIRERAIRLYKKFGFETVMGIPVDSEDEESFYVMRLRLHD